MAIRTILRYPDPRLQQVAAPVERVDDSIRELVGDMAQTMYEAPGIGLAATQVDVHLRIIVIDLSEKRDALQVFINPEIVNAGGDFTVHEEGCLCSTCRASSKPASAPNSPSKSATQPSVHTPESRRLC